MNDENVKEDKKTVVMGKLNEIRSNIESFVSDLNVNELKTHFNKLVQDAQKDFNRLVNKDLEQVKSKLQKEKEDVEKKAKKFLETYRRDVQNLQTRFEKLKSATVKLNLKSKPAATTKKKATKKVAKATKKVAKTTKKTVSRK